MQFLKSGMFFAHRITRDMLYTYAVSFTFSRYFVFSDGRGRLCFFQPVSTDHQHRRGENARRCSKKKCFVDGGGLAAFPHTPGMTFLGEKTRSITLMRRSQLQSERARPQRTDRFFFPIHVPKTARPKGKFSIVASISLSLSLPAPKTAREFSVRIFSGNRVLR